MKSLLWVRNLVFFAISTLLLCDVSANAASAPTKETDLRVYFIDVEGGQSTLFITPSGTSLLVDTGSPGFGGRDADRIVAAAKLAGLDHIDYVLLTHYHSDHTGGVPQLVERFPVVTFIDHGENREFNNQTTVSAWQGYQKVLETGKYHHIVAHPGDVLPIPGIKATVVTGDGKMISRPMPGGGSPNPYCAESTKPPADTTENGRSLGLLIKFGNLKILDLGDLTRDKEIELMCPNNLLGHVDVLVVSHHGLKLSSSPALVKPLGARVAIMDNSAVKGGAIEVMKTIESAPGLETLWQLHYSNEAGAEYNTKADYIANLEGPDEGHYLELIAKRDGSFRVFNPRNNTSEPYPAK